MIDLGQNITCSLKVLKYYKLDVVPVLFHGHNIYGAPRSNAIYTILDGDTHSEGESLLRGCWALLGLAPAASCPGVNSSFSEEWRHQSK